MIPTLTLIALLAIPKALVSAPTMLLQTTERQGFLILWGCVCGAVDIGLDFLLVGKHGANGAASPMEAPKGSRRWESGSTPGEPTASTQTPGQRRVLLSARSWRRRNSHHPRPTGLRRSVRRRSGRRRNLARFSPPHRRSETRTSADSCPSAINSGGAGPIGVIS